jgi:hypothetical protein
MSEIKIENQFKIKDLTYPFNNNIIYRKRINSVTTCNFNYVIIEKVNEVIVTKKQKAKGKPIL